MLLLGMGMGMMGFRDASPSARRHHRGGLRRLTAGRGGHRG
jgi:hypothetical protein